MRTGRPTFLLTLVFGIFFIFFFFQAEDGIRDIGVTGVQTCALPISFLTREVPRWFRKNKCFSCHNNGDAARALYHAVRLGFAVPRKALADTSEWLEIGRASCRERV